MNTDNIELGEILRRPTDYIPASQCKEMGIMVGDTIFGRRVTEKGWNEMLMTAIYIGDYVTLFGSMYRDSENPGWIGPKETVNMDLGYRQWYRVTNNK